MTTRLKMKQESVVNSHTLLSLGFLENSRCEAMFSTTTSGI
jgi:hypothetical protein